LNAAIDLHPKKRKSSLSSHAPSPQQTIPQQQKYQRQKRKPYKIRLGLQNQID
jgi:hypothetical protein